MPQFQIKIEWRGDVPLGAPPETMADWPRAVETEEEASNFRAAIHEWLDDEFGEQPKTISWDGPFGAAQRNR